MTADQFEVFWQRMYPGTVPLSYRLRDAFPTRWLRIHSLPSSKRYPGHADEWEMLLDRQNTLLADVLRVGEHVLLVTGEYDFSSSGTKHQPNWQFSPEECLQHLPFIQLTPVDLSSLEPDSQMPDEYKLGDLYRLVMTELPWHPHTWDPILKAIAEAELRAFFISTAQLCLIAPYDGGIDLIFQDQQMRDHYQTKYHSWLSSRLDGR